MEASSPQSAAPAASSSKNDASSKTTFNGRADQLQNLGPDSDSNEIKIEINESSVLGSDDVDRSDRGSVTPAESSAMTEAGLDSWTSVGEDEEELLPLPLELQKALAKKKKRR